MKRASIPRKIHKWLFLFVGIQALLWTLSGAYMVVMNLDFIHGDHLVRNLNEPLPRDHTALAPTDAVLARFEHVTSVRLQSRRGAPYYIVTTRDGIHMLDAITGEETPPVDQVAARALAEHYYAGSAPITRIQLLESDPPGEIPARALPVWRVDFNDRFGTSLYIHPTTGALVTRRHNYWRAFDFFWMLHIMDYEEREDIHNPLLLIAAIVSLAAVLAGLILLFYSFGRKAKPVDSAAAVGGAQ